MDGAVVARLDRALRGGPVAGRAPLLRFAPALTVLLLAGPVAFGLAGAALPAFGFLPALGGDRFSLEPWRALFATPGLWRSAALSLWTGLAATALSLGAVVLITAAFHGGRVFRIIQRLLSPLLAVPHAAAAFGLAFVIAPSGWISRALSPWATGWTTPPDALIVGDRYGLSLIAGLVAKEAPFLLLMTLAALRRPGVEHARTVALSLGYGRISAWIKAVLPRTYAQIRLPVYAVLAYSVSAVEVSIILGPTTPATLAVRLTEWMRDPDLSVWFRAAAGAMLQLALALVALGLWRLAEIAVARRGRIWTEAGGRGARDGPWRLLAGIAALLATAPVLLGLASLAVWSAAGLWPFPATLPESLTLRVWAQAAPALAAQLGTTLALGSGAVAVALALCLATLEAGRRRGRAGALIWLVYLPLLAPQVTFLFGLQALAVATGLDGALLGVMAAHVVFVLPYVFLSLADPYAGLDPRYAASAAALGAGENRVFWTVRLPLLLAPALTAAAVGLAVSVGLYLPTLLVGGGRVVTLTTEAVALAAGGDRRLIGAYGLLQTLAPAAGFALALAVPALVWRNRRALRGGG